MSPSEKFAGAALGVVITLVIAWSAYEYKTAKYVPPKPVVLLCSNGVNNVKITSNKIEYKDGAFWIESPNGTTVPYVKSQFESCIILPVETAAEVTKPVGPSIENDSSRSAMLAPFKKEYKYL